MEKEKQILLMHFDGFSQRDICVPSNDSSLDTYEAMLMAENYFIG